jgi:hypothetical protein
MKKIITLFLVIFISCGPSEEEIQARIDNAVEQATSTTSSTTTSSTTTTTIERVEWTPSEIEITCPSSKDLIYGSNFQANYTVTFGSNPTKISLTYYDLNNNEESVEEWTPSLDPVTTWEKGYTKSTTIYNSESFPKDVEFFYFTVQVEDSSGVVTEECKVENDTDIYSLPPIAETTECPKTIGQNEEFNVEIRVLSRTADVEYVQWEFQDDTLDSNYADLIVTDELPEKGYKFYYKAIKYTTGNFNYSANLSIIATVYDSFGRSSKAVCGIRLEP